MNFISPVCFGMEDLNGEVIKINSPNTLKNRKYNTYIKDKSIKHEEKQKRKKSFYEVIYYIMRKTFASHSQIEEKLMSLESSKSGVEALPPVIIREIITYLDLISMVNLSHASRKVRKVINCDFWNKYNSEHNYQSFNEKILYFGFLTSIREASPVKVALANYHYKKGLEQYYKKNISEEHTKELFRKSKILGLQIVYSECYCCGRKVPRDLRNGSNLFCSQCVHIAGDGNQVEKTRKQRYKKETRIKKEIYMMDDNNHMVREDNNYDSIDLFDSDD